MLKFARTLGSRDLHKAGYYTTTGVGGKSIHIVFYHHKPARSTAPVYKLIQECSYSFIKIVKTLETALVSIRQQTVMYLYDAILLSNKKEMKY